MKKLICLIVLLAVVLPVAAHIHRSMVLTDEKGREWVLTHKGFTLQQWDRLDTEIDAMRSRRPGVAVRALIERTGDGKMRYVLETAPLGATDSDEECASETATMCDDAGHGPGSQNAERTQHLEEDGGGCTCTADCGDGSGTQAFIVSNDACG